MRQLGTLLVLSVVFSCSFSWESEHERALQRLRRSPYHHCPPYFYGARQFPGPPPFWPPPPHRPYFEQRQNYQNEIQPQNFNQNAQSQSNSQADPVSPQPESNRGEIMNPENPPCDKCEKGQSSAISNAKSVSGSAVAVSIAGKGNNT